MTPYEVLGISERASSKEITAAYRVLAQIFHPDRFVEAPVRVQREAERRMAQVNEAYALARKGFNGEMGGAGPATKKGGWRPPTDFGKPWAEAARERAEQSRKAKEERRHRERMANNGQAVPRSRPRNAPTAMAGMGEARHTNSIVCRTCKSLQWLPAGWENTLEGTVYHCSFCDRLLLSR